jgi:hypothetical protein
MQQPQDFIHFKSSDFPKILVDLYRHGFKWATFNHLQLLEFRLWLSQGNWQSGYYLEINRQFHNLFDAEDEIHNFQVPLLEDGTTDGWFPPYQFESDLLDCQYMNVFGEFSTIERKIESKRVYSKELKRLEERQKKVVFVGFDPNISSCLPITVEKYDVYTIRNEPLLQPIEIKSIINMNDFPKNRKERRERERQIKKQNNK